MPNFNAFNALTRMRNPKINFVTGIKFLRFKFYMNFIKWFVIKLFSSWMFKRNIFVPILACLNKQCLTNLHILNEIVWVGPVYSYFASTSVFVKLGQSCVCLNLTHWRSLSNTLMLT